LDPLANYRHWNADAIEKARKLLQRGENLAVRTARLSDNAWVLLLSCWQRAKRRRVLAAAAKLRTDVAAIDIEIIDYWRITGTLGDQTTGAEWFSVQMSTRAIIRDTILRYANDAIQTIHESQLRAVTRATLWVSLIILFVSFAGAIASFIPLFSDRSTAQVAPGVVAPSPVQLREGECIGHPPNDPTRIVFVTCDDISKASKE
jgi:hypothetical protein